MTSSGDHPLKTVLHPCLQPIVEVGGSRTTHQYLAHTQATISFFHSLGFTLDAIKSHLQSHQIQPLLGVVLNFGSQKLPLTAEGPSILAALTSI